MKKILLPAFVFCITAFGPVDCFAKTGKPTKPSLSGVCPKVLDVRAGGLFVYKNSAPVRASSAITAPIVGFRREPTLIMNRSFTNGGSISVLDSSGKTIGSCPWAAARGAAGGRARCAFDTGGLRRTAVGNTRNPGVLFKLNSSTCVSVPDAGKCFGSNKGLCSQTLQ